MPEEPDGDVAQALGPAAPRLLSALDVASITEERIGMSADAAGKSARATGEMSSNSRDVGLLLPRRN